MSPFLDKENIWKTVSVLLTTLSYVAMITLNSLVSYGTFGKDVGEISNKYSFLITPKSYAFSIWGLIFLLTGVYMVTLLYRYFILRKPMPWLTVLSGMLAVNFVCNGLWGIAFVNQELLVAFFIILIILITCTGIYLYMSKMDPVTEDKSDCMGRSNQLLQLFLRFGWISIYWAWILGASLLNLCLVLKYESIWKSDFVPKTGYEYASPEFLLSIAVIFVLLLCGALYPWIFGASGSAITILWTLVAILLKLYDMGKSNNPTSNEEELIVLFGGGCAAFLLIMTSVAIYILRQLYRWCEPSIARPRTAAYV